MDDENAPTNISFSKRPKRENPRGDRFYNVSELFKTKPQAEIETVTDETVVPSFYDMVADLSEIASIPPLSSQQPQDLTTDLFTNNDYIFDWSIASSMSVRSSTDFKWLQRICKADSPIYARSLSRFSSGSFFPAPDEPVEEAFFSNLYYWIFPSDGDLTSISYKTALLSRLPASKTSPEEPTAQSRSQISFLIHMLSFRKDGYFYVFHGDLNVLYYNVNNSVHCRVRLLDRRHVAELTNEGIIPEMDPIIDASQKLTQAGDDWSSTWSELKAFEDLYPGSTRIHKAGQLFSEQLSEKHESFITRAIPIIIDSAEKMDRFHSFLNRILGSSSLLPVIVSNVAFEGASLKRNKIEFKSIMKRISECSSGEQRIESIYRAAVSGLILPHSVFNIVNILKRMQSGQFSIQLEPYPISCGFNGLTSPPSDIERSQVEPYKEAPPGIFVTSINCFDYNLKFNQTDFSL